MKKRCLVKVRSLNQEKIINKLSHQLKLFNYKRRGQNCFEFEVLSRDLKKTKEIILNDKCEILSVSYLGVFKLLKKNTISYGIFLGVILMFILYCLQFPLVWKIEVYGIENGQKIEKFIKNNLKSRLKYQINTKEIEIKVRENFVEVSSISVGIIGQSLIANINTATIPDEMGNEFAPILSAQDALITSINLIQGTLNCKVGDIVQKGDVLVFPYIIDSQGETRAVKPKAEIIADVWIREKIKHFDTVLKTERTGKKIELSQVFLGDILLYSQNKKLNFEQYQEEISYQKLSKNLILPLNLKKITYFETKTLEINEPFNENKDKIIAETRNKALIFLNKNEIIKEESLLIKEETSCHEITYILTVSRNIGG